MGVEFPCEQTLEVGIILILKEIILMGDEIEAFRDFHYFLACMGVGFYFVLIREKIVLEHPTTSINS